MEKKIKKDGYTVIYCKSTPIEKILNVGKASLSKKRIKKYNKKQGKVNFSTLVKTAENWQRIVDRYESPEEQYIKLTQGE
jgi:hypothetical protein